LIIVEQQHREKAILVGVVQRNQTRHEVDDHLDELAELARTAGVEVLALEIQDKKVIDPAYFIGKGKAESISSLAKQLKAEVIIFDDDLSAAQAKNLENLCEIKVLDRSGLILDIFATKAKTKEAKTQVELAQLQYLMPRLTGRWTHFSRQTAGAGVGLRGPGEKQLEIDRRLIKKRIRYLTAELEKIKNQRQLRRYHRDDYFKVALVGYTNVGKSTVLNALTASDVFVDDRLFATLDSTIRKMDSGNEHHILLIDTVGFIRKLPHHLVASFRSTLEEVIEADLLLHVIDITSPIFREHMAVVNNIMNELQISEKPVLKVFNKVDQLKERGLIETLRNQFDPCVIISAQRGLFLEELKQRIIDIANQSMVVMDIDIDLNRQKTIAQLHELAQVMSKTFNDGTVNLKIRIDRNKLPKLDYLLNHVA
jgi:GTPase